jgi:hypothetical protein
LEHQCTRLGFVFVLAYFYGHGRLSTFQFLVFRFSMGCCLLLVTGDMHNCTRPHMRIQKTGEVGGYWFRSKTEKRETGQTSDISLAKAKLQTANAITNTLLNFLLSPN